MTDTIEATAECIRDGKQSKQRDPSSWKQRQGHEEYFGHKLRDATDPALPLLWYFGAGLSWCPAAVGAPRQSFQPDVRELDLHALVVDL